MLDLGSPDYAAKWFLVQTNYDNWGSPPVYDDRRTPAIACLMAANRTAESTGTPDANAGHSHPGSERKQKDLSEMGVDSGPMLGVDANFERLDKIGNIDTSVHYEGINTTFSLLFNVLSTRPVLNKLTTYTTLMSAEDGFLASWLRDCPDPCWPW